MAVTIYGGSDTSYAENLGAALGLVTGTVWADFEKTQPLTDLRDANGNVTTAVTTATNGHYKFGVNGWNKAVYVDFGLGPYLVQPADLGDRLVLAETTLATLAAQVTTLAAQPAFPTFTDGGTWAPDTDYAAGAFRYEPDGSRRIVTTAYKSGATYGTADTTNSKLVAAPASTFTQAQATSLFAPLSASYTQEIFWDGGLLSVGFDMDPNGFDMPAPGQINQLVGSLDLMPMGADLVAPVFHLNTGRSTGLQTETLVGTVTIADGTVAAVLQLSSKYTYAKKDKLAVRIVQVGSVFPGQGLKIRAMLGSETAARAAIPGAASGLTLVNAAADRVTISWTPGTGSNQAVILRGDADGSNMRPYWNVGTVTTFTDAGPDGKGLAAGESHTYKVVSRCYDQVGAASAGIVAGPSVAYDWLPNATGNGAMDPAMATATIGSGVTGTPVAFSGGGTLLTLTGGTSSTNSPNDAVTLKHVKDPNAHTGVFVNALWHPLTAGTIWSLYLESTDPVTTTGTARKDLSIQFQQTRARLGGHFGTVITSANGGTGTAGSFQNLTDPAYPTNMISGATRDNAAGIILPTVFSTTADVGTRIELLAPVSGVQTLNVKQGTAAQYGNTAGSIGATAASMPTVFTATIPALWTGALAPGYTFLQLLGILTAGQAPYQLSISDFKVGALTAAGV